ncbi:MAG: CvpA family protein [Bacteroidales bacterium]|uniref:CvpA family protein n=1 Tax=Porphyromonas sp. TaxID=1924944 RepID=UPI002976D03D|nr:CvpA family protein [Porphyromonas sp.]MDD7438698.1 CvpA family protein [Bacteroidales bacterium]MDY3066956.1 CvpA family protein [Porphyromonas sp.]
MNWLDIVLLVLLVLSVLRGYRRGFVAQAIELGSVVLAWIVADPFSAVLIDLFAAKGVSLTAGWITWLLSFVVVLYLTRLLAGFLLKGVGQILGGVNRLAGAVLSLFVTTMLLVVLLNVYASLSPRYGWGEIPEESTIAPEIQKVGETILPTRLLIEQEVEEHLPTDR